MKIISPQFLRYIALLCFFGTFSNFTQAQAIKYTYDALGRVTFVEDGVNGNRDYDYDKAGNRLMVAVNSANDAAAEPTAAPLLPAPVLNFNSCNQSAGQYGWVATWQPVTGAHHYVFRLGDNYLDRYTPNEPNYAIRVNGTSTSPIYVPTSSKPCKWVVACDANNVCGAQAYF